MPAMVIIWIAVCVPFCLDGVRVVSPSACFTMEPNPACSKQPRAEGFLSLLHAVDVSSAACCEHS